MRVLVCGGRDFDSRAMVYVYLDRLHRSAGIECIIHGGARGADDYAHGWAYWRSIDRLVFIPEKTDKTAPLRRNTKMLKEGKPDIVIAFPGKNGTADMIRRARAAKIPVVVIEVTVRVRAPKKLQRFFA